MLVQPLNPVDCVESVLSLYDLFQGNLLLGLADDILILTKKGVVLEN